MSNAQQLVTQLLAAAAASNASALHMDKVIGEIGGLLEKVSTLSDELTAALAAGQITPELEAAVAAVVASGNGVQAKITEADSMVPDPEPVVEPGPVDPAP